MKLTLLPPPHREQAFPGLKNFLPNALFTNRTNREQAPPRATGIEARLSLQCPRGAHMPRAALSRESARARDGTAKTNQSQWAKRTRPASAGRAEAMICQTNPRYRSVTAGHVTQIAGRDRCANPVFSCYLQGSAGKRPAVDISGTRRVSSAWVPDPRDGGRAAIRSSGTRNRAAAPTRWRARRGGRSAPSRDPGW